MTELRDLEPEWIRYDREGYYTDPDITLGDAHGLKFRCPQCGQHDVFLWFDRRGVPKGHGPEQRHVPRGDGFHNLSLGSMIMLGRPSHRFMFITNGRVT